MESKKQTSRSMSLVVVAVLVMCAASAVLGQQQKYGQQQSKYGGYQHAVGYGSVDSRYFKHGNVQNELKGGTCAEFLRINALNQCCAHRDDDCYMIHFDTRCYCDVFCDRSRVPDNSDCCPDAGPICGGEAPAPAPPTPAVASSRKCYKNGKWYEDGESFKDNCNECRCINSQVDCTNHDCLINAQLLDDINGGRYGWKAANYSNFWGKPLEYGYKNKLGTKIPSREQRALQVDDKPYLESYDFRNEAFMQNNPRRDLIRDQGDCAASWAFSTIDVATDRTAKVYEGKRGNESASVQMLISCAILPGNANGCSPASVDVAWKFLDNLNKDSDGKTAGGLVNDKCYPYESGKTGFANECKINTNENKIVCPSDNRPYSKPLLITSPGYQLKVESPNEIMEEIYKNGPVQAIFKVYDDFFMYKSGVYSKHPSAKVHNVQDPYHSVKVLGWGSENGVDYWLAANSWGEQWGENGYFKIKRDDEDTEFGRHVYASWGSRPINSKNKNTIFGKRNRNMHRRE